MRHSSTTRARTMLYSLLKVLPAAVVVWTCAAAQTTSTVGTGNTATSSGPAMHAVARTGDSGNPTAAATANSSLALGELSLSPASQAGISVKRNCPAGYAAAPHALDAHFMVCEVRKSAFDACSTRPGFYACGRNATECCAKRTDNSCFAGAFACSLPGSATLTSRTACCIAR